MAVALGIFTGLDRISRQGHTLESLVVQPPKLGAVVELPKVGGLHHRYERRTA